MCSGGLSFQLFSTVGMKEDIIMNYVTAEDYLCFYAILEMIIEDMTGQKIDQNILAEHFGIKVPQHYQTDLINVSRTSEDYELGAFIDAAEINSYFVYNNLNIDMEYKGVEKISECNVEQQLNRMFKTNEYLIAGISYGVLYNIPECREVGHCTLIENIIGEDADIYDPGPKDSGKKRIKIEHLYEAMRIRNGGFFIFNKRN